MAYECTVPLTQLEGSTDYKNKYDGKYHCVALVQKGSGGCSNAPLVGQWKRGVKVLDSKVQLPQGTIIATFDEEGKYPISNRHAAIYVSHDANSITVYDQWIGQDKVLKRDIRKRPGNITEKTRDVNDADYYYVVE